MEQYRGRFKFGKKSWKYGGGSEKTAFGNGQIVRPEAVFMSGSKQKK